MAHLDSQNEILRLINKYLHNKASQKEIRFLEKFYQYFDKESGIIEKLSESEKESLKKEMLSEILKRTGTEKPVVKFKRSVLLRQVAAAAALILTLGTGGYFIYSNIKTSSLAKNEVIDLKPDLPPGGNKALLTLSDGSTILLDSAQNGVVASQANTKVLKLDNGRIAYNSIGGDDTETVYNMISTPRGGQYELNLPDGSRVMLNASSSIRFPVAFKGAERKVEITGEAYFEVTKDRKMPFIVTVRGMNVEVLGTHFNISAYEEDKSIKTTLLEGSVKVTQGINLALLSPGEQAQLNEDGDITVTKGVNTDEIVAWTNGWFEFNSFNIEEIMLRIGRWYDVDIEYNGQISKETFSGIVSRSSNISQVLMIMEQAGIKFKIEGKKITVINDPN
ncbi:MAG: hypothetical protein A2X18_02930 [Bacteroidetes bacterium GWF2_40_14]|nr:MAG: hypothetical protein A2X18_02930 [Bacteroidetes bacterium GWF2_40_14]